ncbi:MAG: M1 family metallopeptidase [Candidatus Aminicenantes bacterium]|nr:M1 family metallopeptidase [Candidatus Aminicenantes bacterium]
MNKYATGTAALVLLFWGACSGAAALTGEGEAGLVDKLQAAFNSGREEAYTSFFVPELKEQEAAFLRDLREGFAMERASLYQAQFMESPDGRRRVFFQALFENAFSVMIQTWDCLLQPEGEGAVIAEKKIRVDPGLLYKVSIPSGRVEAASRVEIRHRDISLVFSDAYVFYDNIPGLDTALLVIGRGRVAYSPSSPREKHQLELAYKTRALTAPVGYAFCRFSNHFFRENVRVVPAVGERAPAPEGAVAARAAALFQRHYPRYFTVVNSLTGERYSFLPQGEEAVLDFLTEDKKELTYIYTPFSTEEIHLVEQNRQRLINLYSPPEEEGQRKMFISFKEKFDVLHYDLEASVVPKTFHLSARARLTFKSRVDNLDSIKLRLNKDLEIVRVQDHLGRELFNTRDKFRDLLYIYFLEPCGRDESLSLEVLYRGRLVPPDQTMDVLTAGQTSETFILTPPRYDSLLYSRSAGWYPEPTDEDYFTARQKIIVPPENVCVANGLLVERSVLSRPSGVVGLDTAGHAVYVFEAKEPVKYLSFIVGTFDREARSPGPPPLDYLISSGIFSFKRMNAAVLRDILDFYEGLFGAFPYEALTVVHRLWPVGGGHSPASFVVINELPRSLDSRLPINVSSPVDLSRWKEYFAAHEIAHQWWGQGLTWESYHDQWLSEGLAQFSTVLFLGEKYGERTFLGILEKFCQGTNAASRWGAISLGARLSNLNFEAYQVILYNKSAVVLNLLKEIIGPQAFFAGLRDFFRSHRFAAARTADFRRAMERSSGRDLAQFFRGWFDSHELPDARIGLEEVGTGEDRRLQVKVRQMSGVFVFPLWLEWQTAGGRVVRKVIVEDGEAVISLPFQGQLKTLRVNPHKIVPGSLRVSR